ncbi:hypothetical protein IEQ34_006011 [Dendrobium chrysotoxum]|uniref:Uncharacterized protein n=1 Tax=Dendrobium chrysotoxum TaxID=161865 RepID=A0AAV7HE98_DENCH|nr:hypothetical protein IEQ34_006011 [Dendrobium chrysotoxum]
MSSKEEGTAEQELRVCLSSSRPKRMLIREEGTAERELRVRTERKDRRRLRASTGVDKVGKVVQMRESSG